MHHPTLIVALLAASPAYAMAPPATKPAAGPPAYTPVRWNEDYSYLRDPSRRSDVMDRLKYIPLGAGDSHLSLGGQARVRYELFDNNNFGTGRQDGDGFTLYRLLLHADLHLTPYLRAFVQGKSALADGRDGGARTLDEDELDLQQGFVDLLLPLDEAEKLLLRGGRQDLIYGAQRIISPLDWPNARRTFDGVKLSWITPQQSLDAFWVRPTIVESDTFNSNDEQNSFAGLYDTIALPKVLSGASTRLELYALSLNKDGNHGADDADTFTLGTRFNTNPRPWDFDIELDYQFGNVLSDALSAWSVAVEGGYTLLDTPLAPRLWLGFDYASGDSDPGDDRVETFNQLFPLGHAYFGYIDVIGRQNIVDLHPGVELTLAKEKNWVRKLSLRGDYHLFWRASDDDAVYNAAGAVLRADNGSDRTFIGSEIDLLLNWQINRHYSAYVGYSHFFAGAFIEETGAGDDIDFFYIAGAYTF